MLKAKKEECDNSNFEQNFKATSSDENPYYILFYKCLDCGHEWKAKNQ